ncbi:hypothetical protein [Pseudonocardia xishanensis]|uniref:Uncharacterized protein n=1 Tax=Pseudonocardia xishanensis TaxID=630995 RepID=A0ABP8RT81_9PSEU
MRVGEGLRDAAADVAVIPTCLPPSCVATTVTPLVNRESTRAWLTEHPAAGIEGVVAKHADHPDQERWSVMSMWPPQPEGEQQSLLIAALVRAHRETQVDQRAAIAAERQHDLSRARMQLAAIDARLRRHGAVELADQLGREAEAGATLVAALTSPPHDDPSRHDGGVGGDELDSVLSAYTLRRNEVHSAVATQYRAVG